MLLMTVFDQISGSGKAMLLILITEKGPRAAKKVGGWPTSCTLTLSVVMY